MKMVRLSRGRIGKSKTKVKINGSKSRVKTKIKRIGVNRMSVVIEKKDCPISYSTSHASDRENSKNVMGNIFKKYSKSMKKLSE